jgi:ribosomal protein S12 methylthiotransferase accessory factor
MTTEVVAVVGDGPAADALRDALADSPLAVERRDGVSNSADAVAVVATAGAGAFDAVDAETPLVTVELGGVGGQAVGVDAAVGTFAPGGVRYADLRARVASNADDDGPPSAPPDPTARLAGAVAARRLLALVDGDGVAGTVVELTGSDVGAVRTVRPVPDATTRDRNLRRDWRDASLDDALSRAERALDDRVGLVREVGERESFPVPYYLAATADTRAFSDERCAEYAAGVSVDWDAAFMKALGEGLERYCAGIYRSTEFTVATETRRARPVPPRRFVRPDGYETPDREERIQWVDGENLATGESVSLPADFVHYPPPSERYKPAITTGLGLGNSGTEALLSGLYEVIERDATMLAWYSTFDPLELAVDDGVYDALRRRARAVDLSATALLVTQDVDVPVVAAAVHRADDDGEWPRFAAGSAAHLDPTAAARSALAEALQNWMELRAMGPDRAAREKAAIGEYADFPRAARTFVDAAGPVPAESVGPDEVPTGEAELDAVVDRLTDAGLDAYAARTTTEDVESLGFEAVRALVPGAQPLFTGEAFFGDRARTVPEELGFESRLDGPYHPFP